MGLLDSVLGSVLSGQQGQQQSPLGNLGPLAGMLGNVLGGGQQQGGAGGLNMAALLPVVVGMLSNNSQGGGGLGGLASQFSQAGLGHVLDSWTGSGQNLPISGDQLSNVLGGDTMSQIAAHLGTNQSDAAGQLAQVLPGLIDKLTPHGQAPQGGLGGLGDVMGMLNGLVNKG